MGTGVPPSWTDYPWYIFGFLFCRKFLLQFLNISPLSDENSGHPRSG